jgi:hypothetical protein
MHPILRKQLQAALSLGSPEKARFEALVTSVHHQYRTYEKEADGARGPAAERERQGRSAAGAIGEGDDGLRMLLDNIKDSIVSVDARGRIRSMNATSRADVPSRVLPQLIGKSIDARSW